MKNGSHNLGESLNLAEAPTPFTTAEAAPRISVTLLTGGIDRPYTFGLATELVSRGVSLEIVGGDGVDFPEFHTTPGIRFLNLRGSQRADVSVLRKILRLFNFYVRMIGYALVAKPKVFHILWNNKLQYFDRTVLTLLYRALGKRVVLTVHNVNAGKRDNIDSLINRLTLRIQYRLAHQIFVHSDKFKQELLSDFGVYENRVTVIPFGINNAVPKTALTPMEARLRLGIPANKKAVLFFGRITEYKGLEYLVDAFKQLSGNSSDYFLMIVGRPENASRQYWNRIENDVRTNLQSGCVFMRAEHVPDEETELYFKAADAFVLPYRQIYQSGVLYLGYSFGLPILASDIGDFKDEILQGQTGFVFRLEDPAGLGHCDRKIFPERFVPQFGESTRCDHPLCGRAPLLEQGR